MINAIKNNRNLLKSILSILSVDTLVKASNLLLLPIYLKLMLPEEYGMFAYVIGFSTLISSIGSMGMYGVLNRYFYDNSFMKNEVISTLLILLIGSIVITILISLASSSLWINYLFSSNPSYLILALAIFSALHSVLIQFIMGFFYIKKDYKEIQIFNISRLVLVNSISLCVLYFFNSDATVERLVGLIFSELIVVIFFLKYLLKYFSFNNFNKRLALLSLKFGYPLTLSAILGFIYAFADKYFIQSNFGFSSVGEYVFIFMFASLFGMIFSAIQNFWLPFFFNPKNKEIREKRLLQLFSGLFLINVIYYIGIVILLKILFYFNVFDSIYENGMRYLWLLVFAQFFSSVQSLYNNYYSLYDKTLYGLYVSLISAITSLIVMYLLVSTYQVYGVSIAVLINSIVGLILTIFFVNRLKKKYAEQYI
jgi:O-antigen/teichoic acid export membrane protein